MSLGISSTPVEAIHPEISAGFFADCTSAQSRFTAKFERQFIASRSLQHGRIAHFRTRLSALVFQMVSAASTFMQTIVALSKNACSACTERRATSTLHNFRGNVEPPPEKRTDLPSSFPVTVSCVPWLFLGHVNPQVPTLDCATRSRRLIAPAAIDRWSSAGRTLALQAMYCNRRSAATLPISTVSSSGRVVAGVGAASRAHVGDICRLACDRGDLAVDPRPSRGKIPELDGHRAKLARWFLSARRKFVAARGVRRVATRVPLASSRLAWRRFVVASATLVRADWVRRPRRRRRNNEMKP
jgi:hypothetical protein